MLVQFIYCLNIFVTSQSQLFFASQAFAGISLASSGRMARLPRSRDRLDEASEMPAKACEAKNN